MGAIGLAILALLVTLPGGREGAEETSEAAEQEAAGLLERALGFAAKGRYERAASEYRKIAERFPTTEAGHVARRRSEPNALLGWADIVRSGPSENRVDFVVMGDGYPLDDQGSFDDVAADVQRIFERDEVFGEYFGYLNVIRANVRSEERGIDGFGRTASTALDARVWEASSQGQVLVDHERVHDFLEELPAHDGQAIVLVPRGTAGTGGGGVAAVGGRDFATMIHEVGHSFGGLGDEYDTHTVPRGEIRERPNVSATDVPGAVPWRAWIEAEVPGIGIYEGADGRVRGAWKPTNHCRMASADTFCPVCREALVLRIHDFVDPIDSCTPPPTGRTGELSGAEPHEFEVVVMRPERHVLEVSWWVLPASEAPRPQRRDYQLRSERGPLRPIEAEPESTSRVNKRGIHRFRVDPRKLDPGSYRVVCRARDTTHLRGERRPWVLTDPRGVLESERGWAFVVE